jgi:hypothetical protein
MAYFRLSKPMGHKSAFVMAANLEEEVARLGPDALGVRLTEPSKDPVRNRSAALAAPHRADLGSH